MKNENDMVMDLKFKHERPVIPNLNWSYWFSTLKQMCNAYKLNTIMIHKRHTSKYIEAEYTTDLW